MEAQSSASARNGFVEQPCLRLTLGTSLDLICLFIYIVCFFSVFPLGSSPILELWIQAMSANRVHPTRPPCRE